MKSKKITLALMLFYLLVLIWVIVFKMEFSIKDFPQIRNINLIPFSQPVIVNGKADISEIILNVLAFIPYGLFLHTLMDKKSILRKILIIFAIGASDITDIISNTLGGMVGLVISILMAKLLKDNWVKSINIISIVCAALLTALFVILFLANM